MDTIKYSGIDICYTRDGDLSDQAKELLRDYYMLEHETSPQEAFARVCTTYI